MTPKGKFILPHGQTTIEVMAFPREDIREENSGFYNFEYQIKGVNSGIFKDFLLIKIVPLKDSISISADSLLPSEKSVIVRIKNRENTHLQNVAVEIESPFFTTTRTFSLSPKEEINFSVELNKNGIEKISAGPYIVSAEIEVGGEKEEIEGIIDYLEEEGISVEKSSEGFIINKKTVKKTNVGNIPVTATVEIKKDALSRLFTINSPNPKLTERDGLSTNYLWEKTLQPDEFFVVESTTNYTFPFIALIMVVLAGLIAKKYSQKNLSLKKKISLVKTKRGEFALKINLQVKARKHVDRVQIIDTLPMMTSLYEKFGKHPDRIDKNTRKLFWNVGKLSAGEERFFSYIIYSKLNVVGRFELPAATVIFECEGKTEEVWSNKTFFVSEKD